MTITAWIILNKIVLAHENLKDLMLYTYGCIYNRNRMCALSIIDRKEIYGFNSSLLSPLLKITQCWLFS